MVSLLFPVVFLWKVILMMIPWDWLTANLHNTWMKAFYPFYLKSRLLSFFSFFLLSPFLPFSLFPSPLSFPELLYSRSALGNLIQFLTKGSGKIFEDTELWNQGPIPTPINLKKIRRPKGELGKRSVRNRSNFLQVPLKSGFHDHLWKAGPTSNLFLFTGLLKTGLKTNGLLSIKNNCLPSLRRTEKGNC